MTTETDLTARRVAGVTIAITMLTMVGLIVHHVFFVASIEGTGPGGAITTLDWTRAFIGGEAVLAARIEFIALALFAGGAIAMAAARAPGLAGWALAGAGALINVGMFPQALGTYPPGVAAEDLTLLTAARETVQVHFRAGNALIHSGLAIMFLTAGLKGVMRIMCLVAATLNVAGAGLFFAWFSEVSVPMPAIGLAAIGSFLATAFFALFLCRRTS